MAINRKPDLPEESIYINVNIEIGGVNSSPATPSIEVEEFYILSEDDIPLISEASVSLVVEEFPDKSRSGIDISKRTLRAKRHSFSR